MRYITVTPEIKEKQKLSVDHGALVRGGDDGPAVMPNSPASKAGVMAEDVIVAVNGKQIGDELGLGSAIGRYNVGDTVTVKVNRGGKDIELKVTLEKRPE